MVKFRKILVFLIITLIAVLVPLIIFHARSPVLIVSEESFVGLYGEDRIKEETSYASFLLFRRVIIVTVANDAGDDIVPFALAEISSKPFCVLFPLRFSRSARLYKEQNPGIPVILLEGRGTANRNDFDYIYGTDIESDFQKAALIALTLSEEGRIAVFIESRIMNQARSAFLEGLGPEKALDTRFYTNFSQYSEISELSCVVLAGIGGEFYEKKAGVPVITFSWLSPSFIPNDAVLVINDSPVAQALAAVRMAASGENEGKIKSNFVIINHKNIDNKLLRKIKKIGKNTEIRP